MQKVLRVLDNLFKGVDRLTPSICYEYFFVLIHYTLFFYKNQEISAEARCS